MTDQKNECWCGRTRDKHQLTRWLSEWGERHDFSNVRQDKEAILPMLATNAKDVSKIPPHWIFERKYDGMRAMIHMTRDSTHITSRNGLPLNEQFPEILQMHLDVKYETWLPMTLDCELVVFEENIHESLELLQLRMGQTDPVKVKELQDKYPVRPVLLDIVHRAGAHDLENKTLRYRRRLLRAIPWRLGYEPMFSQEVLGERNATMKARTLGWEGIVAKDPDSLYEPGKRRASWKKWKITQTIDAVVIGSTEGKGLRDGFGALELALSTDRENPNPLQAIGLCGSGFTEEDIKTANLLLEKHVTFVIECEFMGVTKTGLLREPRFKGFRFDKNTWDCGLDQLEGLT